MQRKKIIPWAALVLGLAGGVLRAFDLARGYDPETSLPTGAPFELVLLAVLAAAAALLLPLSRAYRRRSDPETAFEAYFSPIGTLSKTVSVLCAACFAGAGAAGLVFAVLGMRTPHALTAAEAAGIVNPVLDHALNIPLWLLAILTAVMLVQAAAACARGFIRAEQTGLFVIPVFWALFDLILTFRESSGNPITGQYFLDLLAVALLAGAFYLYAGFLFDVPRPASFVWTGGFAVVCGLSSGIGELGAWLMGVETAPAVLLRQVCYLGAAVWLTAQLMQMPRASEPMYIRRQAGGDAAQA